MEMTLSNAYLNENLDILDQLGFPKRKALEVLQLDEEKLRPAHGRVCIEKFRACIEAAAGHTFNPHIGVQLGLKFRVGAFGDTGGIYSYCEDLEQVMTMNNLYQKVAIDAGKIKYMRDDDGGHHMCFSPYYSDLQRYRSITDIIMASYVNTYRWLSWGSGEDVVCTKLPYVTKGEKAGYEKLLQTRVDTDSERICVQFSDVAMTRKLTTHNPELLSRARMSLDKLVGRETAKEDFETGVEAAIKGAINTGRISAQIVADRMGLSASAFRTRLAETGEGMRPRTDRVRKALFIEKHKAGLTFAQISHDLAYNDQAAMNRAFRRWFDMTPTQWQADNGRAEPEA